MSKQTGIDQVAGDRKHTCQIDMTRWVKEANTLSDKICANGNQ